VTVPPVGERYRGVEGHVGFLLVQAWYALRSAMDAALRPHDLTPFQYGALSVLARDPGLSGADLARACNLTPQSINEVLPTLERKGLIERRPHPTHGRILQSKLTDDGRRRLEEANPAVRALEEATEDGFTAEEIAMVKTWLVEAAKRL
jgi:DNA-binding MarR family transcriptional regulator